MLQTVVFRNHRPGSARVASHQFIITSAKNNSEIFPSFWEDTIKPGAHILQSMIVSSEQSTGGLCQFASCNERLTALPVSERGYNWYVSIHKDENLEVWSANFISPKCGRWSIIQNQSTNILQLISSGEAKYSPAGSNQTRGPLHVKGPFLPAVQPFDDDINCFRRIHTINSINPVKNLEEAFALLKEDPKNARALQFLAWFGYPHRNNIQEEPRKVQLLESIIDVLEISIISGMLVDLSLVVSCAQWNNERIFIAPHDSQTWYLLGRAYMDIQQYRKAYDSYQQAVYLAYKFPGYWNSIGVLYFAFNRYRDSRRSLAISVRLNPSLSEPWYNLGVLVSIRRFHKTKIPD